MFCGFAVLNPVVYEQKPSDTGGIMVGSSYVEIIEQEDEIEESEEIEELPIFRYERTYLNEEDLEDLVHVIWKERDETGEIEANLTSVEGMDFYRIIGEDSTYTFYCEGDATGEWRAIHFRMADQTEDTEELSDEPVLYELPSPVRDLDEEDVQQGYMALKEELQMLEYTIDPDFLYYSDSQGIHYKCAVACDQTHSYMEYIGEYGSLEERSVPDSYYYIDGVYNGEDITSLYFLRKFELSEEEKLTEYLSEEDALDVLLEQLEYKIDPYYYRINQSEIKYLAIPDDEEQGGSGQLRPVWFFGGTMAPYNQKTNQEGQEELFAFCIDAETGKRYELGLYASYQSKTVTEKQSVGKE